MEETSIRLTGDFGLAQGAVMQSALRSALALDSVLPESVLALDGMSGRLYRRWINTLLGSLPDPRYLEVGSWAGSTACSAMWGNKLKVRCIDNWSEFGGPKDRFQTNTDAARSPDVDFALIENDFRRVDYAALGSFNVYLFDGPHEYQDQMDGITIAQPALADRYIQIVDDWNWPAVRQGTFDGLRAAGATIRCGIEVRTTQDDTHPTHAVQQYSAWHNGYYMALVERA